VAECGSRLEMSLEWWVAPGRLDCGWNFGMDFESCGCLGGTPW